MRIRPRISEFPPAMRRPYQPKAFVPESTTTGWPAKPGLPVASMRTGPPMIGRPGDAGWMSFDPVRLNRIVSRPGFVFAAMIASRRLQCATEHVPSLASLFEVTV